MAGRGKTQDVGTGRVPELRGSWGVTGLVLVVGQAGYDTAKTLEWNTIALCGDAFFGLLQ